MMEYHSNIAKTIPSVLPRGEACLGCRKRRQKCDAAKPECRECVSSGRKCQYEDETYKTKTQQLKDRIKELEAQIQAIEEKRGAVLFPPPPLQSSSEGSQTRSSSNASPRLFSGSSRSPGDSPPTTAPSSSNSIFAGQAFSFSSTLGHLELESNLLSSTQLGPPPDVIKSLLGVFLSRPLQCGFELQVDRAMQNLQSGAIEPIIPALLNAMLLMACHFAENSSLRIWEETFLERAKSEIESNITRAHGDGEGQYNPLHHFQAMFMLGMYHYFKGRLLEGHFHTAQAARFAITLGMHQLNSRIFKQDSAPSKVMRTLGAKRWRPRDSIELGEAINVWWSCLIWDQGGSTLNGLPPSVAVEEVTTVWPYPLSDFEPGHALPDDDYSTASLLDPELSYIVADVSKDNVKGLLAKASVLMHCAVRLDTERNANPGGTKEWWALFERCDRSMGRFMQTMPPVHAARNVEELAYLVLIHTAIYCGEVQLHGAIAEYEAILGAQGDPRFIHPDGTLGGLSYDRCSEACRASALATTILADMDMSYIHMFMGIGWVCVSEVVIRDVPRLRLIGQIAEAEEKERQWKVMERCMEKLVATYPVLSGAITRKEEKPADTVVRSRLSPGIIAIVSVHLSVRETLTPMTITLIPIHVRRVLHHH